MLDRARLLLFDLDGTLLDASTSIALGFNRALARFGVANDIADTTSYYRAWADIQREDFEGYLRGEQEFDQYRMERTSSLLHLMSGVSPEEHEVQEFLEVFQQETSRAWLPCGDVDGFFAHLADWYPHLEVAVISNGSQASEQAKLDAIGLNDMPLFSSQQLGMSKPDPEIFRYVCAQLETDPGAAVHIGDNYLADVAAPIKAGLKAVWVNRHRRAQRMGRGGQKVRSLTEILRMG